jgi:anti-sigma factor RsiW
MSDHWTDRLSEYLDGELAGAERAALEAHLAECPGCARTVEELRRVVGRARALEDRAPTGELWPAIAARIGAAPGEGRVADLGAQRARREARPRGRRVSISLPQLAAASIALMALSGGAAWLALRAGGGVPARESPVLAEPAGPSASFASSGYEVAIAELQQVLESSRDRLDTATVRVIEENLAIIDQAIAQAQRALALDPGSTYLREYLAGTMRQKLEFLQQAAQMAGAIS